MLQTAFFFHNSHNCGFDSKENIQWLSIFGCDFFSLSDGSGIRNVIETDMQLLRVEIELDRGGCLQLIRQFDVC